MKEQIKSYRAVVFTEREYNSLMELIRENEQKHLRELRVSGDSTKFINKALNKLHQSKKF